jgi:formylglycine-generating enzyme required for sulfatase activity
MRARGFCRAPAVLASVVLLALPTSIDARRLETSNAPALAWVRLEGEVYAMGGNHGHHVQPRHRVAVAPFRITRSEVTVAQYRACVTAGRCTDRQLTHAGRAELGYGVPYTCDERCNWGWPARRQHPINCVSKAQAAAFCRWVGGRLPSEAEWEYAARSGGRSWDFPWGEAGANCKRAVMAGADATCARATAPVCSRPRGRSLQGLCDLAGNVWEWVQDCWHRSYDGAPIDGTSWQDACDTAQVVIRGGSFANPAGALRSWFRMPEAPSTHSPLLGFRCARAVPE